MAEALFVGVDIGTTSTKAIIYSATGAVVSSGSHEYSLLIPQPGWAEQEPAAIFDAFIAAVRDAVSQAEAVRSSIVAIGVSAAMHSVIAVDHRGRPLTNSIIWADNRSVRQMERLKQQAAGQALYERTGTPLHPMLPLTKLIWLREHAPATFASAAKFISIKEYVLYQLFGRFVVDYAVAASSGFFNLRHVAWDQQALAAAAIRAEQLSELVAPTHILRGMKAELAAMMGIDNDTPVVVGASDGVLANLGVGAIETCQRAVTIGTSSAVRAVVRQPLIDPLGRTFCYPLIDDRWVVGGASNNGGIILNWLRDQWDFTGDGRLGVEQDTYAAMIESASKIPVGAEGLVLLPFFTGERAPYWNADARGVLFGLGLHHTRAHIVRATLEGIVFAAYSIDQALRDVAGEARQVRASGGFARSPVWRQMLADVFGYQLITPTVYEGSSFGAAVLAMYSVGALSTLEDVHTLVQVANQYTPDVKTHHRYHTFFAMYERLYRKLVDEFGALAAVQRELNAPL